MGELKGPKGESKAGCATKIFLVPQEWGQRGRRGYRSWSATELEMRLGVGSGGEEGDCRSEDNPSASLASIAPQSLFSSGLMR